MSSTLQLGIIGQPLTHSLSPILHAQLMHQLGINGEYRKYELESHELGDALQGFASQGIRGLNVTIPYKTAVMPLVNWISPEARLAGAVNTILFEGKTQEKKGYNTDITGFVRSLPPEIIDHLPESHILILGSGGSARSIIAGLIQLGVAAVTLAVRNPQKAVSLLSDTEVMKQTFQVNTQVSTLSLYSLPSLGGFNGLINTTPVGMWPEEDQSPLTPIQMETLPTSAFVYDLIYRPTETKLLQNAKTLGLHTVNGLDMLIYQGICSFELWQEHSVPLSMVPSIRQQLMAAVGQVSS